MLHYDHALARSYTEDKLGLLWDEKDASDFDELAKQLDLDQEQFEDLVCAHAYRIAQVMYPSSYSRLVRLGIALRFLLSLWRKRDKAAFWSLP